MTVFLMWMTVAAVYLYWSYDRFRYADSAEHEITTLEAILDALAIPGWWICEVGVMIARRLYRMLTR